MAGKQFELEQVLKYRLEMERARKQEFAAAKKELDQASDFLKQQEVEAQGAAEEFSQRQAEFSSVEEMRRYADYFERKREDIRRQKERVEQLGVVLDERREVLLDATKDKKVLESLKEKKACEFRIERDQKEQGFMDEIAVQKQGDNN
ncbi:MAG TPA: flagellar export protein FliJ [Deltaproteobacteria bacterium]|nr:flagellar export protein FliJ [Deltaproteobacteria bacterium]HQB37971.1 flagellar export protein FliJ [Deltaproteobacteria bacterium]